MMLPVSDRVPWPFWPSQASQTMVRPLAPQRDDSMVSFRTLMGHWSRTSHSSLRIIGRSAATQSMFWYSCNGRRQRNASVVAVSSCQNLEQQKTAMRPFVRLGSCL